MGVGTLKTEETHFWPNSRKEHVGSMSAIPIKKLITLDDQVLLQVFVRFSGPNSVARLVWAINQTPRPVRTVTGPAQWKTLKDVRQIILWRMAGDPRGRKAE